MAGKDNSGLWSAMAHGGFIRQDKWRNAKASGEVIGVCAVCGGYLVPDDPPGSDDEAIQWFTARCLDCGHEWAAPGGRVRPKRERRRG